MRDAIYARFSNVMHLGRGQTNFPLPEGGGSKEQPQVDKFERKLDDELNKAVVPQQKFARILGREPYLRSVAAELVEPELFGAFGPGELINRPKSALVFWNFVSEDGKKDFTLFVRIHPKTKPGKVTVNLAAQGDAQSFYVWVLDRLGAVDNGDEAPLFTGSGAFTITSVRQLSSIRCRK